MRNLHAAFAKSYTLFIPLFLLVLQFSAIGQSPASPVIAEAEVRKVLTYLSSDELAGRKTFSPEIEIAADYIADQFRKAGLQPLAGNEGMLQNFYMIESAIAQVNKATVGTHTIPAEHIICQTSEEQTTFNSADYEITRLGQGENAMVAFRAMRNKKGNQLVLMHSSHEPFFKRIKQNTGPKMPNGQNMVYLLTPDEKATDIAIDLQMKITQQRLSNVAGMLPGKSKPDEFVVFSAHYDHIGIGKPNEQGDSIYNGANDDASGTTAVILLADYFAKLQQQERTLIFVAFTGEEVGGFGSQHFSKQVDPEKVVAMFNIEMIGTESKWGTNSAYITGYEKSSMGEILGKNLEGSPFKFYPDPYPQQQLFYRSDNATLARLGVPAHTISTSKMDSEPHYHKASDEIGTLDTKNMAEIIKSIAISSMSIVAGKDAPTRVDTTQLR